MVILRLTHWGRVTHICVGKLTIIGSDNGLSPGRRQAIIWTNAGIGNKLQWNFNRNSNIFIHENAFENVVCEMASICLGLNELTHWLLGDTSLILNQLFAFHEICMIGMLHERLGSSYNCHLTCFFNSLFVLTSNIKAPLFWLNVKRIHR